MNSEKSNKVEEEFHNRTFLDQKADNILIITRGHPFERDPFFEMIDSTGYPWSHVEHPAAQDLINLETQKSNGSRTKIESDQPITTVVQGVDALRSRASNQSFHVFIQVRV